MTYLLSILKPNLAQKFISTKKIAIIFAAPTVAAMSPGIIS